MKRLFLVRHAKSSWDDPSLDDMDRPLNNRGKRNAPEMGIRLRKQGIIPDLLISSPAKRAHTTAKSISEEIGYPKKKIVIDDRLPIESGSVVMLLFLISSTVSDDRLPMESGNVVSLLLFSPMTTSCF